MESQNSLGALKKAAIFEIWNFAEEIGVKKIYLGLRKTLEDVGIICLW